MENHEKTQVGWRLPAALRDLFVGFCAKTDRDSMEEEAAAALHIYMHLPEKIRELAKLETKGVSMVEPEFWSDFDKALELGIKAQLKSQRPKRKKSSSRKK